MVTISASVTTGTMTRAVSAPQPSDEPEVTARCARSDARVCRGRTAATSRPSSTSSTVEPAQPISDSPANGDAIGRQKPVVNASRTDASGSYGRLADDGRARGPGQGCRRSTMSEVSPAARRGAHLRRRRSVDVGADARDDVADAAGDGDAAAEGDDAVRPWCRSGTRDVLVELDDVADGLLGLRRPLVAAPAGDASARIPRSASAASSAVSTAAARYTLWRRPVMPHLLRRSFCGGLPAREKRGSPPPSHVCASLPCATA